MVIRCLLRLPQERRRRLHRLVPVEVRRVILPLLLPLPEPIRRPTHWPAEKRTLLHQRERPVSALALALVVTRVQLELRQVPTLLFPLVRAQVGARALAPVQVGAQVQQRPVLVLELALVPARVLQRVPAQELVFQQLAPSANNLKNKHDSDSVIGNKT